ncbi:PAS domain-containing protein [Pararhodospirillum photometricum]|uniref:histidine kinase n=1 Tax=Pararhodospirillum photometricum DSM 122 TaxID=1150469 RepID=H6SK47_PARPM|nr:PAS domain-containing protein [Pararhodospirillum photometricum]CCG08362.1 Sensor protein [Pararhodospirillum photometricum DSM 122]
MTNPERFPPTSTSPVPLEGLGDVLEELSCILFRRTLSPEGRLSYPFLSRNTEALLGFAPEDISFGGQDGRDIVLPSDGPALKAALAVSSQTLSRCHEQFRVVTATGETRWLRGSANPLLLPDGTVHWNGIWQDISTWMRAEHDVKNGTVSREGMLVVQASGVIAWANGEMARQFHVPAHSLKERSLGDLFPEARARKLSPYPCGAAKTPVGLTARRLDGTTFPFVGTITSVVVNEEESFLLVGTNALHEQDPLRDTLASPDVVLDWFWETDAQDHLTFSSEQIGRVLGVKPSALIGHSWFEIGLDDEPGFALVLRTCLEARVGFADLVFSVGPEGGHDRRTIRLSGQPLFTPDGFYCGYRGVGTDITREVRAERRAERAQQQLTDAIESFSGAIAVYDAQDRLIICNPAYSDSFDPSHEFVYPGQNFETILRECYSRGIFDLTDIDFDQWIARRLERHRHANGEGLVVKLADGRWMLSRECATQEGGVVSIRTDITELKSREQDLDRLRRRYALILDSTGEGIVGLDASGRVHFANGMAGSIFGQVPNAMIGCCFQRLITGVAVSNPCLPETALPPSPVMVAFRAGLAGQVSDEIRRGDNGQTVPIDFFVAPLIEDDAPAGVVLVFRDATERLKFEAFREQQQHALEQQVSARTADLKREITVRTRVESALRESRERLKGITDSLFEGVVVVDAQGQVVFANPSARQFLECGEIEGHPLDSVLQVRSPLGPLPFALSPFHTVLSEGTTVRDDDAVFQVSENKRLDVAYACSPLGEEAPPEAAVISFRDIQSLKKAQRELFQASRLSSVGQLAAGVAHEINTPIQYIGDNLRFIEEAIVKLFGLIETAQDLIARTTMGTADPDGLQRAIATFQTSATRAKLPFLSAEVPVAVSESLDGVEQISRIVLSMKDFSHPGTSTKTMTDLNRALESTLTVSRNVWKHGAEVVRDFDPALPPVLCHAGEINQVFLNLVVNAVHAIEASGKPLPGTITITTRRDGPMALIRVSDTGTGIPEAIKDRLFDPFFTTKGVGKGTGQGLAICRDVVVGKHGGTMEASGPVGEGATFVVRLPIEGNDENGSWE